MCIHVHECVQMRERVRALARVRLRVRALACVGLLMCRPLCEYMCVHVLALMRVRLWVRE